ncbi:MAG: amino acid adenylation domain-containing protein, partial [Clostridium sp.]|nr:amino acid adenylation domain-containing protein [Clostridium sp.]
EFKDIKEEDAEYEIENSIRPFDLSESPLFRVKILSTSEDKHYIIMDMHHIIGDQSSLGIIMNEFAMLYEGRKLEDKKLRYIDFAQWQNKLIQNGQMEKQLDYWKKEYEDEIPSLEFPTDYVRIPEKLHEGRMVHFELSKELCKNMNQWIKEQHVTPYMLMMSSLSLVLWKYSAKKDLVVGTAVAGRKTEELNDIVGMFVNTLPIRLNIDQSRNKSQHLQYIKQKMLEAFEAQDCQFDMLLEELHVEKDPSRNPLFDVIINYVNMGTEEFTIDGLKMSPVMSDTIATKYDLTFTVAECNGEYSIDIEYSTGLFKEETIRLLGERFISVIDCCVLAPDESLTDLSIVSDEDRRHIDELKKENEKNTVITDTVVSGFERCVSQFGDKKALVWKDKSYTYKELNNMVNKTAILLRESGVQAKDKVSILLERGPEQIISIFAILKCGAAYLPIDCEYPEQRINYMVDDSNSRKVIVQKDYAQEIAAQEKVFLFPNEVLEMKFEENSAIACEITPTDLSNEDEAYVIYTSGSTGQPKGVIISHKGVISTLVDTNYFKADSSDRILQLSNYTFDASVFNIFGALLNGGSLVLAPKEALLEMPKLAQIIREHNITQGLIVTAIFNMLVDYDVTAIKGMDKVFIGGEALSLNHMKKAFACVGPNHLVNLYGPTETTIIGTFHIIDEIKEEWTDIPIGKAITNTSLYVADELGNELPHGVAGELLIGGNRVAKGYLNRDELTKERFVSLKSNPDERVYRTGDKVKMLADGTLQYMGRIDSQIKLRGFRIELGEVERHVASIEGVKEVAAVAKKDRSGSVYIAAYYTVESKEYDYVTPDYIQKVLKKQIPDYLIPSRMLCLESLPITHNGKVDRKALPEIELKTVSINIKAEGMGNTEGTILNLMREVVDNGSMGVDDNFFECGGQSIKAILFTQKLRDLGIDVMVNDLFQYPTAAEFAKLEAVRSVLSVNEVDATVETTGEEGTTHLDEMQISSMGNQICQITSLLSDTITQNEVVSEFSMTPVQKKHYKAKENKGGFTMIAEGTENEIKKKIASLIVKHQLLHCTYKEDSDVWKEHSVKDKIFAIIQSIIVFDISDFDKETKEKVVKDVFHGLMDADYAEGKLLWRIACLKLNHRKIQIVWCFNHCIFDGMSAEILKKQIISKEKINLLDVETVKYEDYVNMLCKSAQNGNEKEILEAMHLKQWAKSNGSIVQKIKQDKGEQKSVQLRIPRNQQNENIWSKAFLTATHFLEAYYQQKEIPVAILNYGRK